MKTYCDDFGRSTVELLAILSVIGLLTISAFSLYRYGIDETIASNTYEEIQKRAVTSLERFDNRKYKFDSRPVANVTPHGYSISVSQYALKRDYVVVSVSGIAEGVCQHLIRKMKKTTTKFLPVAGIFLGSSAYQRQELSEEICPATDVDIQFLFHRSKQANHDVSDVLNTCLTNSDCLTRAGDSTACLRCNSATRLCVHDNSLCAQGYACYQAPKTAYPKCYKNADLLAEKPCGETECLRLVDNACIPDKSLCFDADNTCSNDGFCTN